MMTAMYRAVGIYSINTILKCYAISTHLVGQCVADDPIDERYRRILPERLWCDGEPYEVRQRCAEEMMDTARAAKLSGVNVIVSPPAQSGKIYISSR